MNLERILNKFKKHLIDTHHTNVGNTRSFHEDFRNLRFYNQSSSSSSTGREKFNQKVQDKIELILSDLVPKIEYIQERLKILEIPVTITSNKFSIVIISNTYRYNGTSGYPHTIERGGSLFSKNTHLAVDIIKHIIELSFDKNLNIIENFVFFPLEEIRDESMGYGVGARKLKMSVQTTPSTRIYQKYSDQSEGILDIILQHIERIVDTTCKEHS